MGHGIQRHRARTALGRQGLHHGEFVRGILVRDRDRAAAAAEANTSCVPASNSAASIPLPASMTAIRAPVWLSSTMTFSLLHPTMSR